MEKLDEPKVGLTPPGGCLVLDKMCHPLKPCGHPFWDRYLCGIEHVCGNLACGPRFLCSHLMYDYLKWEYRACAPELDPEPFGPGDPGCRLDDPFKDILDRVQDEIRIEDLQVAVKSLTEQLAALEKKLPR
jgi:hypothetical protein